MLRVSDSTNILNYIYKTIQCMLIFFQFNNSTKSYISHHWKHAPMAMSPPPIQRTSSIEMEPRTLGIDQIRSARDLAIYIVNTETFEEASRIFTEGLQPVVSAACCMGTGEELELVAQEASLEAFRDIASAPF